ncbi:MAG: 7TM-DISM domain-containing protein, partial [Leptospiraceae bacterium]|nr:7TM-DISM domain-containing protein [Leptospiraceae bacterium]
MKYTVVLAFTLLIISCEVRPGLPPPRAVNGVLDLRAWDFSDDGNIKLDGKWEFYRSQLLTPTDFERTAPKPTGFIAVPDNWNSFSPSNAPSADQSMGAEGYATYRLEILLPESDDLSLQIISVSSAYKLFINAEYLAGAGVVSQYRSAYRAQKLPQTIQLESEITRVTILIQVANFVDPYGGIWHSIVLGKQRQIAAMQRNNLASDLFLCGSLLIMGLYHLGLFQFRPKERATLYLGLVCPLVALRSLMTGEGYLFQLLPEFSYDWAVRLEYLSFYAGGPLFIMYLRALFPGDFLKLPYYSYIAAGAALSLLTLLTPPHIFGHSLRYMQVITLAACVYAIFSIIHAIIRRRSGAISFSIGILIFAATIINDLLNNQSFVYFQTGSLAPFGLFVFLFSQAYLLSTRFARAFTQVEDLTANLEKKVEVRTRQLSSALQTIQDDIRLARAIQTSTLPRDVGPLE